MDAMPIEFRGWGLTPIVTRATDFFSATLLVEKPNGVRRAIGPLGRFQSPDAAASFAIEFGKASVDGRPVPSPNCETE